MCIYIRIQIRLSYVSRYIYIYVCTDIYFDEHHIHICIYICTHMFSISLHSEEYAA